jgi:hypothetical protein
MGMLSREDALEIARATLGGANVVHGEVGQEAGDGTVMGTAAPSESPVAVALDEDASYETELCFVFVWNSAAYLASREPDDQLFGNAPVIVSKLDGTLVESGTAYPVEVYVRRYERKRWRWWRRH